MQADPLFVYREKAPAQLQAVVPLSVRCHALPARFIFKAAQARAYGLYVLLRPHDRVACGLEVPLTKPDHSIARPAAPPLAYRIDDDSTSAEIAAACAALWQELQAALCPIIGARGVAALGQRSLQLASAVHPWLVAGQPGGQHSLDTSMLEPVLAQRNRDDAAAAAGTFLDIFRELLSRLIGASLTERLLLTVWGPSDTSMNSTTAQDPTP